MKLSFSTRGWTDLCWEEMLQTAKDMGFSGIEVYNLHKQDTLLDRGGAFHKYNLTATVSTHPATFLRMKTVYPSSLPLWTSPKVPRFPM